MADILELMENLHSKNNKIACGAMQELEKESDRTNEVYQYFDQFSDMLESSNSYVRNRGLILIAANAKWDEDNKIDEIIDIYLEHITDDKPITARQCIKGLPNIAKYKPDLKEIIKTALSSANVSNYPESMRPLVQKDILNALKCIK